MRFPPIVGFNLADQRYALPADFEGRLNLALVAFRREQQGLVDTWLPSARQLAAEHEGLRYYELPTLSRAYGPARLVIDGGMRAGIPDHVARATTITLYLDKRVFREALDLPSEETIYTLLVDRIGAVLWRAEGACTPESNADLERTIVRLLGPAAVYAEEMP
jgi:hypothetical protein